MAEPEHSKRVETAVRSDEAPPRKPSVWLLEDSPSQAARVRAVLAERFDVKLFTDSPSMLEALTLEQPEVLLLDWQVPDISGLEVLRIARATYDEVTLPALILTASGDSQSDLLEALEAGANDFATKPCAEAELVARISTLVRVRRLHDRARRAELQHERALKELAERAAFEQQLIGIVSHDLRTPTSAVALGASLLAKDSTLNERQASIAGRVVSSAGRIARMIRDLLDFTAVRLGQGLPMTPVATDLHELARKVVAEVQMAHPGRQLELTLSGSTAGHWDPDRISQVITNLVTNAMHYSPHDTTVGVECRGDAPSMVSLTVRNQGPAIPTALLPELFSPLHRGPDTSDPNRRSVGLGLFIVDGIVRGHRGTVDVRSNDTEGTAFTVRLPRA